MMGGMELWNVNNLTDWMRGPEIGTFAESSSRQVVSKFGVSKRSRATNDRIDDGKKIGE